MSFKSMMEDDLPAFYNALGDDAIITIGGVSKGIKVMPADELMVEYQGYPMKKALPSTVEGVKKGDMLEVDGTTYTIHSAKLNKDKSEMFLGLSDD